MQYRKLGTTGLSVSVLAFGAGPISQLMVGDDHFRQRTVVEHAIKHGVNWFDTAATYGAGKSEQNLGRVLSELGQPPVHVATKVRLVGDDADHVEDAVRRSVNASLTRLGRAQVTLLQLHNSITVHRGDESTSVTPADVLRPGGIAEVFSKLQAEGIAQHTGITGMGDPGSLKEVIGSRRFETMQTPYHLLNPSAGQQMPEDFAETNYGNVMAACASARMGIFAIRVFAGGALLNQPPSPHTLKTPFFPLDLYERDLRRAQSLRERLGPMRPLAREAIRFAIGHSHVTSAIIGWSQVSEIDEALAALDTN